MKSILILFLVLCQGCSTSLKFVKEGGSPESFNYDRRLCVFQLETTGSRVAWPYHVNECLFLKGWKITK